jgi:translation initiation factor 1
MGKKNKPDTRGFVFSTDPSFRFEEEPEEVKETMPANQQKLKVRLDTKQRAGKAVTLVENFSGKEDDLDELGKKLKNFCGTGGSVKDRQVIIQGDQRDKIMQWLLNNGFKNSKRV